MSKRNRHSRAIRELRNHRRKRLRAAYEKSREGKPISDRVWAQPLPNRSWPTRITLNSPTKLDFGEHSWATTDYLMRVRMVISNGAYDRVVLNHGQVSDISPEAALVLTAELSRAVKMNPLCKLGVVQPRASAPSDLLGQIGYYQYFPKMTWTEPPEATRFFLRHRRGEVVDGDYVTELINHFHADGRLDTQKLYEALIEGMGNALEWGYGLAKETGYKSWWMLGHRDDETREFGFCFYDQGQTIPATIRVRFRDILPLPKREKGSALIKRAIEEGSFSRTKDQHRGTGLPTLKRFVESAAWGILLIVSRDSSYRLETGKDAILEDDRPRLKGTLISWIFRPQ